MEKPDRKEPIVEPYGDCIYCGGEVVEEVRSVDYRIEGQLYIIQNVPAGVCRQCGEMFFTAETAHRMEAAVTQPAGPLNTVPVPVVAIK